MNEEHAHDAKDDEADRGQQVPTTLLREVDLGFLLGGRQVDPLIRYHPSSPRHPVVGPENRPTVLPILPSGSPCPWPVSPPACTSTRRFPSLPPHGEGKRESSLRLGYPHPERCREPGPSLPWLPTRVPTGIPTFHPTADHSPWRRIKVAHGLHADIELGNFDGRIKFGVASSAIQGKRNTGISSGVRGSRKGFPFCAPSRRKARGSFLGHPPNPPSQANDPAG